MIGRPRGSPSPGSAGDRIEPDLTLIAKSGRELAAGRLDDPNPRQRVGIVAAFCGFLRPPKAPRHSGQVPFGGGDALRIWRWRAHARVLTIEPASAHADAGE
jgi:hypothetical protein